MRDHDQKRESGAVSQRAEGEEAHRPPTHPVLSLQQTVGNQATGRLLRSRTAIGTPAKMGVQTRPAGGVVQRDDPPTAEELENPEARREYRRETGGLMFRTLRWLGRVVPGPVGRYLRQMAGVGEGALEGMGETIEGGHRRRDRYLDQMGREAR